MIEGNPPEKIHVTAPDTKPDKHEPPNLSTGKAYCPFSCVGVGTQNLHIVFTGLQWVGCVQVDHQHLIY